MVVVALALAGTGVFTARAADPIKIGFGMAQSGGLSANGKPALLAIQIWKDDVNKKGGLLGPPVELVFYDDQTNPATVRGIYTKLLDVDKVDLVIVHLEGVSEKSKAKILWDNCARLYPLASGAQSVT
jgi:branched-chain amino acid transport system substrate-binding protein